MLATLFIVSLVVLTIGAHHSDVKNDKCKFPFTYRGVTYGTCTTVNANNYWCSLTPVYEGKWEYCAKEKSTDDFTNIFKKLKENEKRIKEAEQNSNRCSCMSQLTSITKSLNDLRLITTDHERRVEGLEKNLQEVEASEKEFFNFLPNLKKVMTYVTKY